MKLSFYGFMPSRRAIPIALKHAMKALEIDETNAEAHTALDWIHQFCDWNAENAEKESRRENEKALELNPDYALAYWLLGANYFYLSRWDEAEPTEPTSRELQDHPRLKAVIEKIKRARAEYSGG